MARAYDFRGIEAKWRARWEADGLGRVDLDRTSADEIFYNLVEFPYPSAEGLHAGHVFKYAGADVFGRYQRMRGKTVFQPMGWDAFGIHSENYALKVGQHPMWLTARTTEAFRAQLSRIGAAWDWSRVVDTSAPEYYRWTQWLLVQLFKAGLMYQAEAPVVWCPSCLTVLAREQLEGERCERCSTVVTERVMRQWFLRITTYADRLVDGLDALEWPERAKRLQRAWIGRSEGREIDFGGGLIAFTTRPETLPGVTFLAVPHGHAAAGETRLHPLTGVPIPVVEADYVVESYGTGVVMGVPAHDDRDARFAAERGLPVSAAPMLDDVSAVGRPAVRYRLHDWLISRQRYWGPPIPIIHCESCGAVPVPEDQLPVVLPDIEEFRPTGTGRSPLADVASFVTTTCPTCSGPARRETDVSDTFVDSAWYFLRYPSTEFDDRPWDDARTAKVLPVDFYAGGPEHVQRHHLYARFITMALHDLGLVPFEEPFPRIRLGGIITKDGAKMSKSRGNVVTPDTYLDAHGSDALRCGLLFTAPWEQGGDFNDSAIAGIERFFDRVWALVTSRSEDEVDAAVMARAVAEVTHAIERFRFNVGLAELMKLVNELDGRATVGVRRTFVRLLAPFAPHLADELWEHLGGDGSVHTQPWPEAKSVTAPSVVIPVQVDGRVRERIDLPIEVATEEVEAQARVAVQAHLDGRKVLRVIHVPRRLVNFVTEGVQN